MMLNGADRDLLLSRLLHGFVVDIVVEAELLFLRPAGFLDSPVVKNMSAWVMLMIRRGGELLVISRLQLLHNKLMIIVNGMIVVVIVGLGR